MQNSFSPPTIHRFLILGVWNGFIRLTANPQKFRVQPCTVIDPVCSKQWAGGQNYVLYSICRDTKLCYILNLGFQDLYLGLCHFQLISFLRFSESLCWCFDIKIVTRVTRKLLLSNTISVVSKQWCWGNGTSQTSTTQVTALPTAWEMVHLERDTLTSLDTNPNDTTVYQDE